MKYFDNALKLLPEQFVAYDWFFMSEIAKMYFPKKNLILDIFVLHL